MSLWTLKYPQLLVNPCLESQLTAHSLKKKQIDLPLILKSNMLKPANLGSTEMHQKKKNPIIS